MKSRLLASIALVACTTPALAAEPADMVLTHGVIHTMDAADHVVSALAISGGRVVWSGTDAQARAHVGPATRQVDLKGQVVMPGLIDGHMHPLEGGLKLNQCSLDYRRLTIPQIQDIIKGCLAREPGAPDDKWLVVISWFQSETQPIGVETTSAMLDALPTKRPIIMMSSFGHTTLASTRALTLAGITGKTPDPAGGQIHHDAQGAPTGLLEDAAQDLVLAQVPKPTPAENLAAARAALVAMARQGVTSFLDADAPDTSVKAFADLSRNGELTARGHFALVIEPRDGAAPDERIAHIVAMRKAYDQGEAQPVPTVQVRHVKLYMDGVITAPAFTGVMLQPYWINKGTADKPVWGPGTSTGPAPYFPPAVLAPLMLKIGALGFDPHMHADGDGAVRIALDASEALRKAHPEWTTRPAIAHDESVDPADYPRFKALGVVPVLSFQWEKRAADTVGGARDFMGPDRFSRLEPSGYLAQAGAPIAYGSDWPVDALDEWFAVKVGVTRTNAPSAGPEYAQPLPGPGLSVDQALRAFTIGAAYELRADTVTGSLEPGKFADLIVLDRDVFHGAPDAIADTKVKVTMVGGKVVYKADGTAF